MTSDELLRDVRFSRGSEERRQPFLVRSDVIEDETRLDLARPAYEDGNPPAALPIGVLFAAKRADPGIRPAIVVGPVIRRVYDDRIVRNAQLVELGQHRPKVLVTRDHDVVVVALTTFAFVLFGAMGPEVHGGRVIPKEQWLSF